MSNCQRSQHVIGARFTKLMSIVCFCHQFYAYFDSSIFLCFLWFQFLRRRIRGGSDSEWVIPGVQFWQRLAVTLSPALAEHGAGQDKTERSCRCQLVIITNIYHPVLITVWRFLGCFHRGHVERDMSRIVKWQCGISRVNQTPRRRMLVLLERTRNKIVSRLKRYRDSASLHLLRLLFYKIFNCRIFWVSPAAICMGYVASSGTGLWGSSDREAGLGAGAAHIECDTNSETSADALFFFIFFILGRYANDDV